MHCQAMHSKEKSILNMHFKLLFKELKDKEFSEKKYLMCVELMLNLILLNTGTCILTFQFHC